MLQICISINEIFSCIYYEGTENSLKLPEVFAQKPLGYLPTV
jgi:hypothetical protein